MSRLTINLVRSGNYSQKVQKISNIVVTVTSVLLFIVTLIVISLFFVTQLVERSLQNAALEYAVILKNSSSSSSKLGAAAYSYEKLKQITDYFENAPEFVAQYNYMIKSIVGDSEVDIQDLSFDSASSVKFHVLSENAEPVFEVVDRLEAEHSKANFSHVKLDGIHMRKDRDITVYDALFTMKFIKGYRGTDES